MIIDLKRMRRAVVSPDLPFGGPPFYPPMPVYPPPEDSGIDSDDTTSENQPEPENDNEGNVTDSSSSDDDPVLRSPGVRYLRVTNGDNVIEAVRLSPGGRPFRLPFMIPPLPKQKSKGGYQPMNQSPERSSSPLYEVELTASDEDDDASLLELVIPAPPSRYVRVPTSPSKVTDSSSSDDDPVLRSPGVRYLRVTNGDNVIEAVRLSPGGRPFRLPFMIPPLPKQKSKGGYQPMNQSPERSSSPLYEVELTASDEDDDASLLELVIPAPPSRYVRVPTSPSKVNIVQPSRFRQIFCCFRH